MSYYKDLSEYGYHQSFCVPKTLNVGWLGLGHKFDKWEPTQEFLSALWRYCKISVAQMRGIHECEFCENSESFIAERQGERLLLGTSEIRVFSDDGKIYAAPTLIYHYVENHHYKPPNEFIHALTEMPAPPSQAYFERLAAAGLNWNHTSVPPKTVVRSRLVPLKK